MSDFPIESEIEAPAASEVPTNGVLGDESVLDSAEKVSASSEGSDDAAESAPVAEEAEAPAVAPLVAETVFPVDGSVPIFYGAPKKRDPQIIVDGHDGNGLVYRSHHLVKTD